MSDSLSDNGLSLTDAAAHLGISERTVLRRIKDGSIMGKKIGEGRGGVWRIYLADLSDSRPAPTGNESDRQTIALGTVSPSVSDSLTDSQTAPAPEVLKLIEMVDRLQEQNQQLWKTIEHWQVRAVEAEQTVKLLMPPRDEPAPAEPEQKRSWWQRMLRRT